MRTHEEQPSTPDPPDIKLISDQILGFLLDKAFIFIVFFLFYLWNRYGSDRLKEMRRQIFLTSEIAAVIEDKITEIRADCDADRVLYGQFHNGEMWANGLHFYRFSAINEKVKPGISQISKSINGIPSEILHREVHKLVKDGIIDIEIDDCEPKCRRHLESIGIRRVIHALITLDDNPVGIVSIQFRDEKLNIIDYDNLRKNIDSISYKIYKCKQKYSKNPIVRLMGKTN
jgi:hypothetical protein